MLGWAALPTAALTQTLSTAEFIERFAAPVIAGQEPDFEGLEPTERSSVCTDFSSRGKHGQISRCEDDALLGIMMLMSFYDRVPPDIAKDQMPLLGEVRTDEGQSEIRAFEAWAATLPEVEDRPTCNDWQSEDAVTKIVYRRALYVPAADSEPVIVAITIMRTQHSYLYPDQGHKFSTTLLLGKGRGMACLAGM
jgi:hypothetical protein